MAFASVGARGTNTLKVSGTTLTVSPSTAIPVGALLAVFVAWDNNNQSSADGRLSRQMSCEDDAGNIYCTVFGGQDVGVISGDARRSMGFIFITKLRTALTTASVITLRHFNTGAPKPAKAVSLWEFSMDTDKMWAVAGDQGPVQVTTRAADPAPISIGTAIPNPLDSQEYLLLHLLAAEGPAGDAYTWDADYTRITTAGTTGGADESNQTINGGFRIATLTSDTVDVTSDTADRDYTQGLVAVCEVAPVVGGFPTTPILDDFNRADEEPLDNGTWNPTCRAGSSTLARGRVVSNRAARENIGGSEGSGQWWIEEDFSDCQEVYASIPVAIVADALRGAGLRLQGGGCRGDFNDLFGHFCVWHNGSVAQGTARDNLRVGKASDTGVGGQSLIFHVLLADGVKFGIQTEGAFAGEPRIVHQWLDLGGGWFEVGAVYYTIAPNHPDTHVEGGLRGLLFEGLSTRVDDFGGGGCPRIFRIIPVTWKLGERGGGQVKRIAMHNA